MSHSWDFLIMSFLSDQFEESKEIIIMVDYMLCCMQLGIIIIFSVHKVPYYGEPYINTIMTIHLLLPCQCMLSGHKLSIIILV